jgi:hypothetical protein
MIEYNRLYITDKAMYLQKLKLIQMKKTMIMFLMALSFSAVAQMKVSDTPKSEKIVEYKTMGTSFAEISKIGNTYAFTYRDAKFTKVDSYKTFYFSVNDIDVLYGMFTNFEGIEKNTEKTVELEDGSKLFFTYKKMLGTMYADVIHIDKAGVGGKINYMNERQLRKLFGKVARSKQYARAYAREKAA